MTNWLRYEIICKHERGNIMEKLTVEEEQALVKMYKQVEKDFEEFPEIKTTEDLFRWREQVKEENKENGEIRQDLDVEETASMFWQVFFGISFEQSFFNGLNIKQLSQRLHFIYSLLKA